MTWGITFSTGFWHKHVSGLDVINTSTIRYNIFGGAEKNPGGNAPPDPALLQGILTIYFLFFKPRVSCFSCLSFSARPTDSHRFVISPLNKHYKTKTTFGFQIYLPYTFLFHNLSSSCLAIAECLLDYLIHAWTYKKTWTENRLLNQQELSNEKGYPFTGHC